MQIGKLVTIPGLGFRTYLKQTISTAFVEDEMNIYSKEVKDLKTIDISRQEFIRSLEGIEYFTALTTLNCSDNELTALDVTKNTALNDLNCSDNQLTALDVRKNANLRGLRCYNNKLEVLDVTQNTRLKGLNCSNNRLRKLDVNTALTTLNCINNQLTHLDLSSNCNLRYIVNPQKEGRNAKITEPECQ